MHLLGSPEYFLLEELIMAPNIKKYFVSKFLFKTFFFYSVSHSSAIENLAQSTKEPGTFLYLFLNC
jgi:hypothetical protein